MLVEIHGAGFVNKGAQLMLETAATEIRERVPDVEFCISAGGDRPAYEAGKAGFRLLWPTYNLVNRSRKFPYLFRLSRVAAKLTPHRFLARYGLTSRRRVDAFVDVSGYAFGDAWLPNYLKNTAAIATYYHRNGKPVVFLPQMFGPFQNENSHKPLKELVSNSDLIYAREQSSYDALKEVVPKAANISIAPDITIFRTLKTADQPDEASSTIPIDQSSPYAVLTPNIRVLDRQMTDWTREAYVSCFRKVATQLIDKGFQVVLLVHETEGKDFVLADEISDSLPQDQCHIFSHDNPVLLKSVISRASLMVGSRYHGLVSSLSTGVPAIALGWAYKYTELLSDFGVREFDISSSKMAGAIPGLLDQLTTPESHRLLVQKLLKQRDSLKVENVAMWNSVVEVLTQSSS